MNQFNPALASKRQAKDVTKLLMSDYQVHQSKQTNNEFLVNFQGPKDTLYQGGLWKVIVHLPDQYPFKSPSIGFTNKIYHPNIDEQSGSVCLDVINQTWSPMFDLINIFDVFLPQLLTYPNPTDPLNPNAANLMIKDEQRYKAKVKEYVEKYAKPSNFETKINEHQQQELEQLSNASISDASELSMQSHEINEDLKGF